MEMKKVRGDGGTLIEVPITDPRPAVVEGAGGGGVEVRGASSEHAVAVLELCDANGVDMPTARDMVKRGLTREQAGLEILEKKTTRDLRGQPASERVVDLTGKEAKRYSYTAAIAAAVEMREGRAPKGFEVDIHQDLVARGLRGAEYKGGILVPWRLEGKYEQPRELRAKTSFQAGKGVETVFDQPGELFDMLRPKSVAMLLGAQSLSGLTAPVPFPREGGDVTISWMGENPATGVPETDMDWETVNLFPKTLMGSTRISRQLI